ncbi:MULTISPECIES: isocitrate/isopropylmalate dehydrogenase family protein [Methylobacterium]|jgi:3-isopropylmalate dehydrogenase|uniref:isocitrate/isopropylmalate dehydrogenase family protein n=1 Tax=Methylobacterium TaxID=407 RepID=UPI0008F32831|nr:MULTISPECIES: isocitrate/isopropylmalate dehydrogenase family protein [Methylobacterium]MBZ6416245.1 isocitrate/isopropylmalate dehydrogenase family protein [Methylobacterium sp.]MBK3399064.1 isocitrate/isopropylmalate dehydrogenase family protein [Methylobacterium ajmalii]MBK3407394.1 isocitrate/isopropylmalate dehydrogenase family protein [Methylobacterium ajmalii]MBK3426247.1 isocitrate/isopropylmalate dehydrogenase family protein [Methylobacterium ajmalii]SFF79631.1 3-isopropylmalate de
MAQYRIATIEGDGIGPEVTRAAMAVLTEACGAGTLAFEMLEGGAGHYTKSGHVLPDDTFAACRDADAILHGAAGLPGVVYPDGTEVGNDLHLRLRFRLDLYANVRPIKLLPGVLSPLRAFEGGGIDYVIVRENTEGLYASRGAGVVLRDEIASDSLVVTRKGTERVARFAFDLAAGRNGAPRDGQRRVTVCDKANILRSYAFFRRICDEVHAGYPDIAIDYAYADAITVHMLKRPDSYDVIVAENMFGDIISDLGAATVGGMGISPSGEIGDGHALFQGAHGSAPDIAGQDAASPIATILSGVMMLRWLGQRNGDAGLASAADRIEAAVGTVLAEGRAVPRDLGGAATCTEVTDAVRRALV